MGSELAKRLDDMRERARLPKEPTGWKVKDSHFFDWLSENMGPENVEYLRILVLNHNTFVAALSAERSPTPPAPGEVVELLDELIAKPSSRAFYGIGEGLLNKLKTIKLTALRPAPEPQSAEVDVPEMVAKFGPVLRDAFPDTYPTTRYQAATALAEIVVGMNVEN